jgi:hypothetical protein
MQLLGLQSNSVLRSSRLQHTGLEDIAYVLTSIVEGETAPYELYFLYSGEGKVYSPYI